MVSHTLFLFLYFQYQFIDIYIGIFAYLHYGTSIIKFDAVKTLINGLKLLEYRGYDSAGLAIGSKDMEMFKAIGPVDNLKEEVFNNMKNKVNFDDYPNCSKFIFLKFRIVISQSLQV